MRYWNPKKFGIGKIPIKLCSSFGTKGKRSNKREQSVTRGYNEKQEVTNGNKR